MWQWYAHLLEPSISLWCSNIRQTILLNGAHVHVQTTILKCWKPQLNRLALLTCLVAWPALRIRDTTLCTRLTFWLFNRSTILASIQMAGCTSCFLFGKRQEKNESSNGAFTLSSSHTVSQLKCSRAGLDFRRRMESCLSEHKGTSSCIRMLLANFSTTCGLSFIFPTAALAMDLQFLWPTHRASFLRECDMWWYLFLVEWLTTT